MSTPHPSDPPAPLSAQLRGAAGGVTRGIVYLTLSRAIFLATRLIYFFLLPRFLASPAEYGNFVVVIGISVAASTVFLNGTQQAVSKLSAEDRSLADAIRTAGLKSRLWICALVLAGFYLGGGGLAALFRDEALTPLFQVAGVVVAANGFFAVVLGSANGTGRFGVQALAEVLMSLLKLGLVLGAAGAAGSALSGIAGFAAAQVAGVLVAFVLIGVRPFEGHYPFRNLWRYESALLVFSLVMSVAVQSDLFLLKALLPGEASAEQAGLYAAAQIFAQVPAALVMSINLVILPVVASALAREAHEEARDAVHKLLGFALFLALWMSVLISLNAPVLIGLVYPDEYLPAASALRVLVFGGAAYTMISICTSIVTAASRPRVSLALALIYLAATWGLGFTLIPKFGMLGSAWTHAGAGGFAFLVCLYVVFRLSGAGVPWRRGARLLTATAATLFLVGAMFEGSEHTVGETTVASELLYLAIAMSVQSGLFFLMGGVGSEEFGYLRGAWRRLRGRGDSPA